MSDERGLTYVLKVKDEFNAELKAFRDSLRDIKKEVRAIQSPIAATQKSIEGISVGSATATKNVNTLSSSLQSLGLSARSATDDFEKLFRGSESRAFVRRNQEAVKSLESLGLQARETRRNIDNMYGTNSSAPFINRTKTAINTLQQLGLQARRTQEQLSSANLFGSTGASGTPILGSGNEGLSAGAQGLGERFKGFEAQVTRSQAATRKFRQDIRRLREDMIRLNASSRQTSSSFTTLFRLIAASVVLRTFTNFVTNLVNKFTEFNSVIEQSQLGIATLFRAAGEVRDPFGNIIEGPEALEASLLLAEEQTKALRLEALRTTATYQELLEAFQVSVAPGFAAGLNVEEIRGFTIQISQAASALGVAQNQLAEEIRSLLQGTINPRNTRIATALQITNEDIRQAREAGRLAEFLNDRFSAFTQSVEKLQGTFAGLIARIRGGLELLVATGAAAFFDDLKDALEDIFNLIATEQNGELILNPEALEVVEEVASGLSEIIEGLREVAQEEGFDGLLSAARALGTFLSTSAQFLTGFFQGVLEVAVPLIEAFEDITEVFDALGVSITDLGEVAGVLTSINALVVSLLASLGLLIFEFNKLRLVFRGIGIVGPAAFGKLGIAIAAVAGIAIGLAKAFENIDETTRDLDLSVWDSLRLLLIDILNTLQKVGAVLTGVIIFTAQGFVDLAAEIVSLFAEVEKIGASVASLLASVTSSDTIQKFAEDLKKGAQENDKLSVSLVETAENLENLTKDIINFADATNQERRNRFLEGLKKGSEDAKTEVENLDVSLARLRLTAFVSGSEKTLIGQLSDELNLLEENAFTASSILGVLKDDFARIRGEQVDGISALLPLTEEYERLVRTQGRLLTSFGDSEVSAILEDQNELAQAQLDSQRRILDIEREKQGLAGRIAEFRALEASASDEIKEAAEIIRTENLQEEAVRQRLVELGIKDRETFQQISELFRARANSLGQEEALSQRQLSIQEKLSEVTETITLKQEQQREARRQQFLQEQTLQQRNLQLELQGIQQSNRIRRSLNQGDLTQRQAELASLRSQIQLNRELANVEQTRLRNTLDQFREQLALTEESDTQGRTQLNEIISSLEKELSLRQQISAATADANQEQAEILQRREDSPISEGISQALRDAQDLDVFQDSLEATSTLIDGFAEAGGNAFAAMFQEGESAAVAFKNTIANVLQDIAQLIARSALASLFASFGSGSSSSPFDNLGSTSGSIFTANTGGLVPSGASIGQALPGTHPADTVPAMLTPNEYVIRDSSVAKYGTQIMEAINRGLVPPQALRALVGGKSFKSAKPVKRNFNTGGQVSNSSGMSSARSDAPLVMPANESTMETLIQGGRRSLAKFIQENTSQTTRRRG